MPKGHTRPYYRSRVHWVTECLLRRASFPTYLGYILKGSRGMLSDACQQTTLGVPGASNQRKAQEFGGSARFFRL